MRADIQIDGSISEASEKRCTISMRVSIKRGPNAEWVLAEPYAIVVPGEDVEVFVECKCRATIDIKPDKVRPIPTIQWAAMSFSPEYAMRTRIKVAYYRPRKIHRPTEVRFQVRARCRCADCAGEDEKTFPLIFDETL